MNILTDTIGRVTYGMGCRKIAPLLVPYSDNRLGRDARARVEAHLSRCAACRDEAQSITEVGALLREQTRQGTASESSEPVPFHTPLWAGIEAEIRRTERPASTEWDDHPVRPRNRWAFALDASWPNRVPVAVAVFSAAVFAMVLADHSHPFATPGAADAMKNVGDAQAISITVRPSATIPALAAGSQSQAIVTSASKASPRLSAASSDTPRLAAIVHTHRSRITLAAVAAPVHFAVPVSHTAAPKETTAATRLASASSNAVSPVVAAPSHPSLVPGLSIADNALADSSSPAVSPLGVSSETDAASSANGTQTTYFKRDATAGNTSEASAHKPAADSGDAEAMLVSSSVASHDEDATVRGDSPAAEPMADFAVLSRRQRNLFSYASR